MRFLFAGVAGLVLAGCATGRPYTSLDLQQVSQAYSELHSIYPAFKIAYQEGGAARILQTYRQAERACHIEDLVDRRDTIDPNTQLFTASVDLDNLCNTIDGVYAGWAEAHGYPWNKAIVPTKTPEFVDSDVAMQKVPGLLRHPASLS